MTLLRDLNHLRKEEVNILLQKEIYVKLYQWTKVRLNTTHIVNEDDELMETSDAKYLELEIDHLNE